VLSGFGARLVRGFLLLGAYLRRDHLLPSKDLIVGLALSGLATGWLILLHGCRDANGHPLSGVKQTRAKVMAESDGRH
jgi:hypothetical protein